MPVEIKNLSIKINIANGDGAQTGGGMKKKKALKKESVIKLVEQMNKIKNER